MAAIILGYACLAIFVVVAKDRNTLEEDFKNDSTVLGEELVNIPTHYPFNHIVHEGCGLYGRCDVCINACTCKMCISIANNIEYYKNKRVV